jgi:hypothetical protein
LRISSTRMGIFTIHLPYPTTQLDGKSGQHCTTTQSRTYLCNRQDQTMEVDGGNPDTWCYNTNDFPDAINGELSRLAEVTMDAAQLTEYSPSRPQLGAAHKTHDI